MVQLRTTASLLVLLAVALALAGCGDDPAAPASLSPATNTTVDLSAVACATDDPADVGELTGAWRGNDEGVYYIRQVGACVWWFGTELVDIEPGLTGQRGFANVASGRVDGDQIVVEWADVPVGNILNGGGLTLTHDEDDDQLEVTEQRGGFVPFGATILTRIDPSAGPAASPSESASP